MYILPLSLSSLITYKRQSLCSHFVHSELKASAAEAAAAENDLKRRHLVSAAGESELWT